MEKNRIRRSNLIIRVAFTLIFIFLFVSVINLQVKLKDLRDQREELLETMEQRQDEIDKLELRIATPIDEEYIERVAREKLGYRMPNEVIFYNDIPD